MCVCRKQCERIVERIVERTARERDGDGEALRGRRKERRERESVREREDKVPLAVPVVEFSKEEDMIIIHTTTSNSLLYIP